MLRLLLLLSVVIGGLFGNAHDVSAQLSETDLKKQSRVECRNAKYEEQFDDCYRNVLKRYRGHPSDLLKIDFRDAIAYCRLEAESNDSDFCQDVFQKNQRLVQQEEQLRRQEADRRYRERQEEAAKQPKTIAVKARAAGVVPGAIVCRDYRTVQFMIDWYQSHWADQMEDRLYGEQAKLRRGTSTSLPPLDRYGCSIFSPGTAMLLEQVGAIPVVSVESVTGATVRGVTDPGMISR